MPRKPTPILLNALHTNGGGGLTYLKGLLPALAADARFRLHLLAPPETLAQLEVPAQVVEHRAPKLKFGVSHGWEQLVLPFKATAWGCRAILSNANYGPVLGPLGGWQLVGPSSVIVHTTPRAAASWPGLYPRVYWATLRALTRLCLWSSPVHFTVAKHVVADYASPRTAGKIHWAPPALPPTTLPQGLERDPQLVLAVGDLYPQKNYPLLFRAFAKLHEAHPQARLLVIGRPVVPALRDELLVLARELNITSALTLVPGVPHDQLLKAMAQAAVYLNTSSAEAFNLPVLEAMASGTPCVLPDTPFQREVADDAALFVEPTQGDVAAAFGIAALGVLTNPSVANLLSRKGLARAGAFGWEKTAQTIGDGLAKALRLR